MSEKRLPQSLKKYIRKEKARIRREFLDWDKQRELIDQLYSKAFKKSKSNDSESLNIKSKTQKAKKETPK